MADRIELEGAIMDAEGAAAVFDIVHSHLVSSTGAGFKTLGLQPRDDLCVTALSPEEQRALDHAGLALCLAVRRVAAVFYGASEERRL